MCRLFRIVSLLALLVVAPTVAFGQDGISRQKQEKILAKKEKKEVKERARKEKKDRKRHLKIQDKEARKRIKRHTKRADRRGSGTHRDGFPRSLFQKSR